jgi:hypothetical protein
MRISGLLVMTMGALLAVACVDLDRPHVTGVPPADAPTDRHDVRPPADMVHAEGGSGDTEPPDADPGDADTIDEGDGGLPDVVPDRPAVMEAAPEVRPPDVTPPVDTAPVPKPNGAACTAGVTGACQSGFCVDGVCCENICNSACYVCNGATPGKCQPVVAGQDPGNDCTAAPIGSCGFDGTCNGMGACRREVAGTTCVAAVCTGSTETAKSACDGAGTCRPGIIRECAPYLCGGDACRTSCTTAADCKAGYACQASMCVIPPSDAGVPDMAPPPTDPILLIDDFSDAKLTGNTMGGQVTWDNQNVSLINGMVHFTYAGAGGYHDFIETFLASFCAYDIRMYRTLRFSMRASAPRNVRIFMARSNTNCATAATPLINTVSVTTTMTTYNVDISAAVRDKALFFEWSPATNDSTDYYLDDIELIP